MSIERLDEIISRLQDAASQLRSGELSTDAAASLVEDRAGIANEAGGELERRVRESTAPREDTLLLPEQDTLL